MITRRGFLGSTAALGVGLILGHDDCAKAQEEDTYRTEIIKTTQSGFVGSAFAAFFMAVKRFNDRLIVIRGRLWPARSVYLNCVNFRRVVHGISDVFWEIEAELLCANSGWKDMDGDSLYDELRQFSIDMESTLIRAGFKEEEWKHPDHGVKSC